MRDTGYAILCLPHVLLREYEEAVPRQGTETEWRALRRALPHVDPSQYRGTERDIVQAYPGSDQRSIDLWRSQGFDQNEAARVRMARIIEGDREGLSLDRDDDLFGDRTIAEEVRALLERPDDFEVVLLDRTHTPATAATLGYDVGNWGGQYYSIIKDSAVMPVWHGPDIEDLEELAQATKKLNSHCLFDDPNDAREFRTWYESRHWAESDGFLVVRVDQVTAE
jgi:hypothetical protein